MSTPHESRRILALVVGGSPRPEALIALAEAAMIIAPAAEIRAPDTVLLDASAAPLFGGEEALAQEAEALAATLGLEVRSAVADGLWPAQALARWGVDRARADQVAARPRHYGGHPRHLARAISRDLHDAQGTLTLRGDASRADTSNTSRADANARPHAPCDNMTLLAPLPLQALELPPYVLERLAALGLDRLGALAELPMRSLAARFGALGEQAVRLARGIDPTPMTPHVPAVLPEESRELEGGVEALEPLVFVAKGLAEKLAVRLAGRLMGATALRLTLHTEERTAHAVPLTLTTPSAATALWMPVLREAIAALRLPSPVVKLSLAATSTAPLVIEQLGLDEHPERLVALETVLSRLESRLGEGTVLMGALADRHRPEGAFTLTRFDPHARAPAATSAPRDAHHRPTRLVPEPQRVEVTQRDGHWIAVRVDRVLHAVEDVSRPERLVGEWWLPEPFDRTYTRVTLRGLGECWLFRVSTTGTTYLHGTYD